MNNEHTIRKNRSSSYQNIYHEKAISDEYLSLFPNEKAIDYNQGQLILELQDRLLERVLKIAPEILTEKQYTVFKMYFLDNLSTPSIAKILNINVSCVQTSLKGPHNQKGNNGALLRLRNYLLKDEVSLRLLAQIEELCVYNKDMFNTISRYNYEDID